jgi:hypothetical protein
MKENLLGNKRFMELFHGYGVERKTIEQFLIGLDIDESVVCPIHDEKWNVIGKVTYFDFFKNPKAAMSAPTCSGFVGLTKTGGNAITVCKDIIDMLLAFQNGIPFPVVATDKKNPPHFFKTYSKVHFMSDKDEMIDLAYNQTFVYGIDDIYDWLTIESKKPLDDRTELSAIKTKEIIREISDNNLSFTNPAVVGGRLYWLTYNRQLALCPDGKMRRSSSSSYGRKLVTDDDIIYFKVTPADISRRYVFEEQKTHLVYSTLWRRFHRFCNFLAEDQCKLLAAYVMYQYIYPHIDHVVHLHIITSSQRQRDYLLAVLQPLMPSQSSFRSKGTSSICCIFNNMGFGVRAAPFIILDDFTTADFDRGLTLLVDKKMCPYPRQFAYKAFKKQNTEFKNKLYSWSLGYIPPTEIELPIKSLYSDILVPLWSILQVTPNSKDQLKVLRNTVARSRSHIRNMKKEEIPLAGHYDTENQELVDSEAEVELIPNDIQSQDDHSDDQNFEEAEDRDAPPVSSQHPIESNLG